MYTGLANLGLSGYHNQYSELKEQAILAARRNNASLWFAGAPSDLAGFVWQDSAGTVPATGTDPIGRLTDRAGSNAATQATAANKPTLELQVNGYFGMRFGPTLDDNLRAAGLNAGDASSTVIVAMRAVSVTNARLAHKRAGNAGFILDVLNTGQLRITTGSGSALTTTQTAAGFIVSGAKNVIRFTTTNNAQVARVNGTTAINTSLAYVGSTEPFDMSGPVLNFFDGVYGLACYAPSLMPAADCDAIEQFAGLLLP